MSAARPEVHLRVLVPDDAAWLVDLDQSASGRLAPAIGFVKERLTEDLEHGAWTSDDRWGWAIVVDGAPAGFALVTGMHDGDGTVQLRIGPQYRGRGVGREVLRQLADHHFAANDRLQRLVGMTHERNIPMQRAFTAAGLGMEARYRDAIQQADGSLAALWGYALTRNDWVAGRHRRRGEGYNVHGLTFAVEEVLDGPETGSNGLTFVYDQDGRRASATFTSKVIAEGELAGILDRDVLRYRYVQVVQRRGADPLEVFGRGRARVQRSADGRLQIINEWSDEDGRHGTTLLVQRVG
jgi:RimJ/RimL family protein N-acetyltransferase